MTDQLLAEVLEANLLLPQYGLVTFTWGNVSAIDRSSGLVAIKPSGVPYESMTVKDLVILDLDGNIVQGHRKPSSDTKTHLEIYKAFPNANAVLHTHSRWATIWSQAELPIPAMGTTHADYFYGAIPVTRRLTEEEIQGDYERNTGKVIVEYFHKNGVDPGQVGAVLVAQHGPFLWGKTAGKVVESAVVLEEIAQMAYHSIALKGSCEPMQSVLLDKHYLRKHGATAYYGQEEPNEKV